MFAPPYSPNKKFSNSKIRPKNLKKSSPSSIKNCSRCEMKSQNSKYFSKKYTHHHPFSTTVSLKTLPNLKSMSSVRSQSVANQEKNQMTKFEPFSTFGQKDSNKFLVTMKQNKTTSLSLERFNKEMKSQGKISYKKVIIQSTKINKKCLVKKPMKKEFENKKIYSLYETLKEKYEKLKAEYDTKIKLVENDKKQSPRILEKRSSKIADNFNTGQTVEQSYQLKTEWPLNKKIQQRELPKSSTSIEGQTCFEIQHQQFIEKSQQKIAQISKQKEFYRQQCLGLEKQLQSVYNTVLELKRQIQILNQKNDIKIHEPTIHAPQNSTIQNQPRIQETQHQDYHIKVSPIKRNLVQKEADISQTLIDGNSSSQNINLFPTCESIESQSALVQEKKKPEQILVKKVEENPSIVVQMQENKENQIKKVNVKKVWRRVICDPNTTNVIQEGSCLVQKNESKMSEATGTGSSNVSEIHSLNQDLKNISEKHFLGNTNETIIPESGNSLHEIRSYKSETTIKGSNYQISSYQPQPINYSVVKYHSYCRKNCDLNNCKCLLEMMTLS